MAPTLQAAVPAIGRQHAADPLLSLGPGKPRSQRRSRSDSTRLRPLRLSSQYAAVSTTCRVAFALYAGLLPGGRRAAPLPLLLDSRPPVRCSDSVSVGGAQKPAGLDSSDNGC